MNRTLSNSSLPCGFTSPKDFLLFANNRSTVITQTITDCPQICNVFYGTGNPDIMGVGVRHPHRPLFLAIGSNPKLISGHPSLCIAASLRGLDWRPVNDHSLDSVRKVD